METIGDGYMVICGAPDVRPNHAVFITDFAFSIIEATSKINDPSTNQPLRIRVGKYMYSTNYSRVHAVELSFCLVCRDPQWYSGGRCSGSIHSPV